MTIQAQKSAGHIKYAREHITSSFRSPTKKTTIRVFTKEWDEFKALCHSYGLTTCFVIRQFINSWVHSPARHTEFDFNFLQAGKIVEKTKDEGLYYHTETQTLYVLDKEGNFKIHKRNLC